MMDCKKALIEANGDIEKAIDNLRKSGAAKAAKKSSRSAKEGLIYSYIHHGGRLGVLLDIGCETDFVAKTDKFVDLARNVSMQIAATNPISVNREDVPEDVIDREKDIYTEQAKATGKPDKVIEKIVDGKLEKYFQESCLMEQIYIKDSDKKIKDLVTAIIATLGENITINRFSRFAVGETD
jgi:elongation factor Ts